jgi:hypothetical protein
MVRQFFAVLFFLCNYHGKRIPDGLSYKDGLEQLHPFLVHLKIRFWGRHGLTNVRRVSFYHSEYFRV